MHLKVKEHRMTYADLCVQAGGIMQLAEVVRQIKVTRIYVEFV